MHIWIRLNQCTKFCEVNNIKCTMNKTYKVATEIRHKTECVLLFIVLLGCHRWVVLIHLNEDVVIQCSCSVARREHVWAVELVSPPQILLLSFFLYLYPLFINMERTRWWKNPDEGSREGAGAHDEGTKSRKRLPPGVCCWDINYPEGRWTLIDTTSLKSMTVHEEEHSQLIQVFEMIHRDLV